ncbi:MAG: hypothetical protein A3D64_02530 [Candidatus Wildermuthbacteria bacterium RIFCSPHIGHO2_02_FULL_49_9]|uniref:Addiction module toxin RelE n=3 Tax=Parcubacteria group TaxID=1794811 RepID=A0A1F8DQ59_9BACT|nr:MAG: hypothetical protein A2755_03070 [Candidatus Wolfebacteria bacterium RIFCSPHIGHO2_01_FULL_48_22]OGM92572.1 MAG: hypothetical protein A2935_01445 [Candidatus Wolfebacteria bacterium RIFCSPLOWO2_01_FULL_47_17b]OHA70125.1 MAG: hypothetical protein A3D64_02530 [Candidatus Wildermuthbacteria bacterium RIFCSPHIGHO2_02_FULL_49_9]
MEIVFSNARAQKFFENIDKHIRPRVVRGLELLERYGNALGMPHSKALGGGLFELRIIGITHIRFVYAFSRNRIFILHIFHKKTVRIAQHDIAYARAQFKAWRRGIA